MDELIVQLGSEPALAWKASVLLSGADPDSPAALAAARAVRAAPLVSSLLDRRDRCGHAYRKWTGSHWVLSILADLGCPPGDDSLRPLMEETCACWPGEAHKAGANQLDHPAAAQAARSHLDLPAVKRPVFLTKTGLFFVIIEAGEFP